MSIIGAILGFAIASIVIGAIGSIFSGIVWGNRSFDDESAFWPKVMVAVCVLMIFLGCMLVGAFG